MQRFDYDVAIIGGGSGGIRGGAHDGQRRAETVVVIEGGEEVGGLCILRGCMPTKALLYMAYVAWMHCAKHAPFGIRTGKISFDFKKAMARKKAMIKDFADYRAKQLKSGKFKFIRANAKFLDPYTVALTPFTVHQRPRAGHRYRQIFCHRHRLDRVAPVPLQLDEVGCITSDDRVALKKLPKSLIILGGGPIACEFAQFFARFGVRSLSSSAAHRFCGI